MNKELKKIFDSFCLEGSISQKHAEEIMEIMEECLVGKQEVKEKIEKLPTGLFHSTPYKKALLKELDL